MPIWIKQMMQAIIPQRQREQQEPIIDDEEKDGFEQWLIREADARRAECQRHLVCLAGIRGEQHWLDRSVLGMVAFICFSIATGRITSTKHREAGGSAGR